MKKEIKKYIETLSANDQKICHVLTNEIANILTEGENKIWHSHPVWFLEGNPIVGYSKQKPGIRLMFWSGLDFNEEGLNVKGKKFKDAFIFYQNVSEIDLQELKRWIYKSIEIQWDYKNIVKRKGELIRLK